VRFVSTFQLCDAVVSTIQPFDEERQRSTTGTTGGEGGLCREKYYFCFSSHRCKGGIDYNVARSRLHAVKCALAIPQPLSCMEFTV
jgi:hypothetical protein